MAFWWPSRVVTLDYFASARVYVTAILVKALKWSALVSCSDWDCRDAEAYLGVVI